MKLRDSQDKCGSLEKVVESLKATITEMEKEVNKTKEELTKEQNISQSKLKQLITEIKKAEAINKNATDHIQELTRCNSNANNEIQRLNKEIESIKKKDQGIIDDRDKKIKTLTEDHDKTVEKMTEEHKKRVNDLEEQIRNMDLLHDEIEELEFKLQTETQKFERVQRNHEAELNMVNDEKETLKLQVTKLRNMVEESKSINHTDVSREETIEMKSKIEKLTKELEIQEKNTEELQLEIDDALAEYSRLNNLNKQYEREKKIDQKEITSLRSALNKLRTQMEDFLYNKVGGKPPANQEQSAIEREQNIRKEFRKLLQETREQYQEIVNKELEKNAELEQHIRQMHHDREEEIFQRVNASTQTLRI